MKVSIIIPVYNVEKYLNRCVDSIILSIKNVKNVEILLIDDGSTDNSKNIVDNYDKKYSFIKSFHKKNGGLSDARNFGLLKSKGDYVIFIDSDDEISSSNFKKVLDKIITSDCDTILWDAIMINEESNIIESKENDYYIHSGLKTNLKYTGIECVKKQLLDHSDYVTTVWLGAYKKEFLFKNHLFFEKNLLHEDELWSIKMFVNAYKVEYIDSKVYLYRQRENSIMNKSDKNYIKNLNDIIFIYSTLFAYLEWKNIDSSSLRAIKGNISRRYLHALGRFNAYKYKKQLRLINKKQLFNNCNRIIDKIRCILFMFMPYFYCKISNK